VLEHQPRERLQSIEISDGPTTPTAFFFADPNGLTYPAFTNPHTGDYLGHIESTHWLRGLTKGLHGGWPINPWGSYLLELGACWAIVMTLTGLYLWWPRNARGLAGVLYPRVHDGSRAFWRDLHAVVGVYFSLIFLAFLFSALPWTSFWGEKILAPIQIASGQASPLELFFIADAHHGGAGSEHQAHASVKGALTLDQVIEKARAAGASGPLELKPSLHGGPVNVRKDHPRTTHEMWLQLDGQTGAVLTRVTWEDHPPLAKAISLGIDLHEGRFFGRINQLFNTLVAGVLVWMCITGFIGWYKRRPSGSLAPPPKREWRCPRALLVTGAVLCIAMPLLGLSALFIAVMDRAAGRWLPQSR
jgi:uncharacterized iron-regulated membrane protein